MDSSIQQDTIELIPVDDSPVIKSGKTAPGKEVVAVIPLAHHLIGLALVRFLSQVFQVLPMDGTCEGPLQHSSSSQSDNCVVGVLDLWHKDPQLLTLLAPCPVVADTLLQPSCSIAGTSPK